MGMGWQILAFHAVPLSLSKRNAFSLSVSLIWNKNRGGPTLVMQNELENLFPLAGIDHWEASQTEPSFIRQQNFNSRRLLSEAYLFNVNLGPGTQSTSHVDAECKKEKGAHLNLQTHGKAGKLLQGPEYIALVTDSFMHAYMYMPSVQVTKACLAISADMSMT